MHFGVASRGVNFGLLRPNIDLSKIPLVAATYGTLKFTNSAIIRVFK